MPIPATSIIHAEIIMQGKAAPGGSNAKNLAFVFHYRRTTVVNAPSKVLLEAIFQANIVAKILLALNARYSQTFTTIRWIDDALDPPLNVMNVGVGLVAGDAQSTLDAAYMLFRTPNKGGSYRGSKHFGPLSEADSDTGDLLNGAGIARIQAIATALALPLPDANGNNWVLQVYSRTLSQPLLNPTTIVATDVSQITFNKRIGRMARREVKSVY